MSKMYPTRPLAAALLIAAVAVLRGPAVSSAAPTTEPATQPAPRDLAAVTKDLQAVTPKLNAALANGMTDPAKRAAAAPTAIPLIKRKQALLREYGVLIHAQAMYGPTQNYYDAMLYLLGDKETVDRVDRAAGSPTASTSAPAQAVRLNARWLAAGRDAAAQQPVADELELLDAAHPDSDPLTSLTIGFSNTATSPELRTHLATLAKSMKSPLAARIAAEEKDQAASQAKLASLANKPLTLSGTTVDGKPFTSDEYKGKVVLVDFWATWCGPCKAELPRVKDMYAKYHDKGLEIIGVSNDYTAEALKKYTAQNGMPWVELLDAPAAAEHQWNPTTLGYGIRGIPTMFLIDKKGVLRTVEARQEMETLIPTLLAE